MQVVRLANETDFEGWRKAARALLAQAIAPENIEWLVGEESGGLFDSPEFKPVGQQNQLFDHSPSTSFRSSQSPSNELENSQFKVPRDFIELCRKAILHSDPTRFGLLYRLLWRLKKEQKLLHISFDPDVARIQFMIKAVRRDLHKMKAFVRFREIEIEGRESEFVAWFEPSHHIVEASAPFFTGRFTNMRWSILTPDICMHWDGSALSYSPGASKADAPADDAGEDLWRSYYRSIFNPARLKISAMQSQMPKKYWRNLPEAPLIAELIVNASQRMDSMIEAPPTEPQRKVVKYVVNRQNILPPADEPEALAALRRLNAAMLLSEFPLAVHATQAVLGRGAVPASIMLLGEQPGEQEDLAGQPFKGPAGQLLNQALQQAGIARSNTYVTNTLKHYKFKLQGTRRVRMLPGIGDIKMYLPWLQGEVAIVQPRIIIALGTVAAHAITGEALEMEANRGNLFPLPDGRQVLVTYHPSFILRVKDEALKQQYYKKLVNDLVSASTIVNAP
ncbi:MAG TPA: UdgX family uracil-DNA binding protein [Methylophilus sp.]|uniref:UdgX family uracil-DNA binding protein n=1 Tax=Methylophilus sp. TaxID=29541 RepID=UPI002B9B4D26|nr:UdgX family uracil-DNA binding protein [Methylophilus sp.]HSH86970.1 UdgX family uracil-DNA binding protein [Methylophilus sp.]